MSKFLTAVAAASVLAFAGSALAQTATPSMPMDPATPMAPATPMTPPASASNMPAAPTAPAASTSVAPATPAAPTAALATGMTLKDNTGAAVGSITELKPDVSGSQMATIKMGEDTFTVAASGLAVRDGAAVINLTQAELQAQVHQPS